MRWFMPVVTVAVALAAGAANAETVVVPFEKAKILRFEQDVQNVIIGNPSIIELTIENPRTLVFFGKGLGETSLTLLDAENNEVRSDTIVVVPQQASAVNVHTALRGGMGGMQATYACGGGTCVQVGGGAGGAANGK